jgi:hypothetical protein
LNNILTTGIVINSALRPDKLNIVAMNIQSIKAANKMDELRMIFRQSRANLIVISESWTNTNVDDTFLELEGYKFLRHDRYRRRGGGLLVYADINFNWSLIEKSPLGSTTEYMMSYGLRTKKFCLSLCTTRLPLTVKSYLNLR